jgi:glycosyltransferase involved in cell wall biosynthesis
MRILCISNYYKPAYVYGGPVRCVSELCEALAKQDCTVTVLTTNVNGNELLDVPLDRPVSVDGVEVFYYPIIRVPPHSFFYSPALAKACHQKIKMFDIVILQTMFTHTMGPAVTACNRAGVPYIVQTHGQLLPWSLKQKRLKKMIYQTLIGRFYLEQASALHCTDPVEAAWVEHLGIKTPKIIVPNGIKAEYFAQLPPRGRLRQKYQISEHANLLLFLGRLHPKKRPDIAIEALAITRSLPRETHLMLAGPDEMQMAIALRTLAQRLGCENQLHFTGLLQTDDVLSALADSDLFLMPSEPESENFGMSALEAMAAGLPVLVSDGVPVGRWAEASGAGRMIPCSKDAFRDAIRKMLNDPEHLKDMGRKGQALVQQKFDISIVTQQMLAQYRAILSQGKPLSDQQMAEA